MRRVVCAFLLALAIQAQADYSSWASVKRKFELIQTHRVAPGSRVTLKQSELNGYVEREVALQAPEGVRQPRVELGNGTASGFAYVDFPKLSRAHGKPMNRLLAWMLDGERPVRVDTRIQSGNGQATVFVEGVEVSGMAISGGALDWLIRNYLLPRYPTAKIGEPFQLQEGIERLEVRPGEVRVVMQR